MSDHESEVPDADSIYGQEVPEYSEVLEEVIQPKPQPTSLQIALQGRDIHGLLPELSDIEQRVLIARFDPDTGMLCRSQREAARLLGISTHKLVAYEGEALDQIRYLINQERPKT